MARSAIEIRSPPVSSMSSSRGCGSGVTCSARSMSSSVVSPMAETTTTTSSPARRRATIRLATCLMRSASPTEDPPYFWTTSATGASSHPGNGQVAIAEFTGAFPPLPASPHRGPLAAVDRNVGMHPRKPAGDGLPVVVVVVRELTSKGRLLVEAHEACRDDQEHRPVQEQHGLAEQKSLSDDQREHREVHRVAHIAVGPADDQATRRSQRGRRTDALDDEPDERVHQHEPAGEAEQETDSPQHYPPGTAALDVPAGQQPRDEQRGPAGRQDEEQRAPGSRRDARAGPDRHGLVAEERVGFRRDDGLFIDVEALMTDDREQRAVGRQRLLSPAREI